MRKCLQDSSDSYKKGRVEVGGPSPHNLSSVLIPSPFVLHGIIPFLCGLLLFSFCCS